MSFLGGLVGFLLSVVIYIVTAVYLGVSIALFGFIAGLPQIGALTVLLLGLLSFAGWVVVAVFIVVIATTFAYTLATISLLPTIAGAVGGPTTAAPPPPVAALPNNLVENFMRGFMIGLTAGLNLGISLLFLPAAIAIPLAISISFIGFLAVFPIVSGSVAYQALLGWTNWFRPTTYLATAVGFLLFFINLPSAVSAAIAAGAPFPVRFDLLTATIETFGGAVIGVTGFVGGFNLGNFTFLTAAPSAFNGVNPIPGGGGAVGLIGGLSSHETGHTLNAGAFGGVFHWINAIDENLVPFTRNSLAYGELTAESHFQRGGVGAGVATATTTPLVPRQHVAIW